MKSLWHKNMACVYKLLHYKYKNTRVGDGTASLAGEGLMIHGPHRLDRHDSDQGCKLGSLCIRFSSDVILGLRKETGYRPGWRSGRHRAEDWSLCSSCKAQLAPEGHLLFPDFYRFTLKYESSRCWQPLWNNLESFHGISICICYNMVRACATGCHFVPIVSVYNTAYDKHLKLRI